MAKESSVVASVTKALRERGAKVIKTHGDSYLPSGTPDLLGSYRGKALALECKNELGRLSSLQIIQLKEWQQAGAVTAVVRSKDQALALLDRIDKEMDNALSSDQGSVPGGGKVRSTEAPGTPDDPGSGIPMESGLVGVDTHPESPRGRKISKPPTRKRRRPRYIDLHDRRPRTDFGEGLY